MKKNRQISFDTETTGLKPEENHRLVEFAGIEIIDGEKTGRNLHLYFNPERADMPERAYEVHGLSIEFLSDKPLFKEKAEEILDFLEDSEIIAHNLGFDVKFLNAELGRASKPKIWSRVNKATDTVALSKMLYPKERKHSLDALCDRLTIDRSHRVLHGALLDAELLADAYLKMVTEFPLTKIIEDIEQRNWERPPVKRFESVVLNPIRVSNKDLKQHIEYVKGYVETKAITPEYMERHIEHIKRVYYAERGQEVPQQPGKPSNTMKP